MLHASAMSFQSSVNPLNEFVWVGKGLYPMLRVFLIALDGYEVEIIFNCVYFHFASSSISFTNLAKSRRGQRLGLQKHLTSFLSTCTSGLRPVFQNHSS